MSRLIWSPAARHDLHAINAYLIENDASAAASKMLLAICHAADRLHDHARMGRVIAGSVRAIGVRGTPYLILYRLAVSAVEIVRIRHGRENWLSEVEDGS